jgi:putative phage-type endonuclease
MTLLGESLAVTEDAREAWLALRKQSVGSSEAAAVLGVCPYRAPIDVWQEKLGLAAPQPENEAMRWGRRLEPLLAEAYQERTCQSIAGTQLFYRHPAVPWMTATVDAVTDGDRLVEFKTTSSWAKDWGPEEDCRVPEPYLVQVHHQLAVTGAREADVAVLVGGQRFRVYPVARDEGLIQAILDGEERFWRCVERKVPPDWGRLDARSLAALYPGCRGEVALGLDLMNAVNHYEQLGGEMRACEEEREALKGDILKALGPAALGRLPDGRLVRRHLQRVPEKTIKVSAHTKHYFTIIKGER